MQDFVLKTKNIIKKIAVIGTMTLMGATAIAGAAAASYTLADYPAPFVQDGKWVGLLVIGADAATADMVGAIDIAGTLAQVSAGTTTGGTSVTGGKEKELDLGNALNDSTNGFSNTLDDDELAGLQDTTITIDTKDIENDYDVHDTLKVGGIGTNGPASVETGLTFAANKDKDFKEDAFMAVPRGSIGYNYVFDDALVTGNLLANASDIEPIEIDFLGKKLDITGATATSITAQVGEEVFMNVGDTVTVTGHDVKLINVGSATTNPPVIVSVDGVTETVTRTEKVGALRVKVKETFYSDTLAERSATLVIGEDASKTYDDGDGYIGEDEDNPNWVWDLANLATAGVPTIGILWDQTYDDPTEVVKIGDTFGLPGDYATIKLDSYTINDYKKYTIETTTGEELLNVTGGKSGLGYNSSAKTIHLHADGGNDDGFTMLNGSYETDDVYLQLFNTTMMHLYYKDHDDGNKIKYNADIINGTANDVVSIKYKDTTMTVDMVTPATAITEMNMTVDEQNNNLTGLTTGKNLMVNFDVSTGNAFEYLGGTDGDSDTAYDVMYNATDISGWDENTRTQKGIVIYNPDSSASGDDLVIDIPSDITDMAVNVIISGPGTSVTHAAAAGKTTLAGVPLAKLDTEVTDKTAANMILVGGSAVNKLTAEAMGLTYPTYGAASGIPENKGLIKLIENAFGGSKVALVVAGWEAANTRDACAVLKDYSAYTLTGTAMEVSPGPTVTAFVAPTVTTTENTTV